MTAYGHYKFPKLLIYAVRKERHYQNMYIYMNNMLPDNGMLMKTVYQ